MAHKASAKTARAKATQMDARARNRAADDVVRTARDGGFDARRLDDHHDDEPNRHRGLTSRESEDRWERNRKREHERMDHYKHLEQESGFSDGTPTTNYKELATKRARGFVKGHEKMGGRVKGTQNRLTKLIKEGVYEAMEAGGYIDYLPDSAGRIQKVPTGEGGIVGFFISMMVHRPGDFMKLTGQMLPMEITGKGLGAGLAAAATLYAGKEEVLARMKELGITPPPSLKELPTATHRESDTRQ